MNMLMIVFRESIAEQIHTLLKEYEVTAFTELQNVSGRGETGPTLHFSLSAGANRLILAAIPEQLAHRLIDGLTRYRMEHMRQEGDSTFPLHVFVLPCEQVV
jgi:nitrogen regulatory protein PII